MFYLNYLQPILLFTILTTNLLVLNKNPIFSFKVVFVIVALGAVILTLNVDLLGGQIVFFQSLCLLGYCLFPLSIASIICAVLSGQSIATKVYKDKLCFTLFIHHKTWNVQQFYNIKSTYTLVFIINLIIWSHSYFNEFASAMTRSSRLSEMLIVQSCRKAAQRLSIYVYVSTYALWTWGLYYYKDRIKLQKV